MGRGPMHSSSCMNPFSNQNPDHIDQTLHPLPLLLGRSVAPLEPLFVQVSSLTHGDSNPVRIVLGATETSGTETAAQEPPNLEPAKRESLVLAIIPVHPYHPIHLTNL